MAFDLILDCAGVFAEWIPTYGFVELTRSGVPRYAHSAKPVYIADSGRIKRIETMLGTGRELFPGHGAVRIYDVEGSPVRSIRQRKGRQRDRPVCHRHGARISIVTEPESLQPAIRSLAEKRSSTAAIPPP